MTRRPAPAFVYPAVGVVSILLAWELVIVGFGVPPFIAPGPWDVLTTLWDNAGLLLDNLIPTAIEAVSGFVLGSSIAVALAVTFTTSRTLQRTYYPIVVLLNTVPVLALAPIMVLIFGLGMMPKIVTAAFVCFVPTLINMIQGLNAITQNEAELMHVLSATRRETFLHLRFWRSLPFLFASLRIAATTSVIGAVVGEWIGASKGLGVVIVQASFQYRSGLLYSGIIVSSALALVMFGLVVLAEKRIVRWR